MRRNSPWPLLALAIVLAGCTSGPGPVDGPAPGDDGPGEPAAVAPVRPVETKPARTPAAQALYVRARSERAAGRLESAASVLERALGIAPNDAGLWLELASLRLEQGYAERAEQFAAKANALAGSDRASLAQGWRLIAAAREARGDGRGAEAARRRAREFE
ncbi:MAG: tetratricopeptide repeat protein [Chromatiales bacterium]|nr:tetratricopeptide repeat protein [Chromatiales bacterium]